MNIYERISSLEIKMMGLRTKMDEVLQKAYETAVETENEEDASTYARLIRNKKLNETDKCVTLDKLLPAPPSGTTFSAWLSWLKGLASVKTNSWANYRQHLRDITKQEGFPFNIDWGEEPED